MPYIDFNVHDQLVENGRYDYTIIGAGAAGILLAVKLTEFGFNVLLIESGHFEVDENRQRLNEVVQKGKILNNAIWGRKRAIGGSTLAWGGQSLPFGSLDFEKRDWVKNSGWPISIDELKQYYHEANEFMKIDLLDYKDEIFKKINIKDPGFDANLINYHVSKWASEPNFKKLYDNILKNKITVVFNAVVHTINTLHNSVVSIDIFNFKKNKKTIPVKNLIIAAGGIETNRILLNNHHLFATADHIKFLGHGFMDHPCVEAGEIETQEAYRLQRCFNTHIYNNKKYSLRLSVSEQFQRKEEILNCSGSIMFRPSPDNFDPYAEIKLFQRDFNFLRFFKIGTAFKYLPLSAFALLFHNFYYKAKATAKLVLMIEQEPSQTSTIALSDEMDEFGQKKALIDWNISELTWKTAVKSSHAIKREMERLKLANVSVYPEISLHNKNWINLLSDVNHHMGGCKMSSSSSSGIVSPNLQVWGQQNLFVCSSAVFPTSSHSNPTLTILALGARLARYLKEAS